ncbi:MAG: 3-deoxy-D-manno-octulosonic acid transferase [Pedobacter sp.]|nr:MAG: 3-deoxy-D-manno-octulosonic acid transferase [Pedobacter sp.]
MLLLYNIAIQFYGLIVRIFSLFNTKAAQFVEGRKHIFERVAEKIDPNQKHIWFHFASLGEFEQGRPVLEKIKTAYPSRRIVITFFSPSGYEIRKDYPLADGVFYLPLDTSDNAKRLIDAINPEIVIFTKYEYWHHYFEILHRKSVPLFIISSIFRPNQIYFKSYGTFYRNILANVTHFFVQNEESKLLLAGIGLENTSVSGDTRFDRVAENASQPKQLDLIAEFCGSQSVMIAGSTWPADEQLMAGLVAQHPDWKFIIAPHEIHKSHLEEIQKIFPEAVKYSEINSAGSSSILIIDNIGLLSSVYQYGKLAYIGGGFGVGIHNTLEAAAFGLPVIFGPNYKKFQEAKDLIEIGAAKSINNEIELQQAFEILTADESAGVTAKHYVLKKKGSTDQIFDRISGLLS